MTGTRCAVCRGPPPRAFMTVGDRDYRRCPACEATLLDPRHWLAASDERAVYEQHRNDPFDPAYRRFLSKLADPLLARLGPAQSGLDYGCGPGPALAAMLREAGHAMALYDPFFHPDPAPLAATYDFVTCTEVAEHFHSPADEFDRLGRLLRPGGQLAVLTRFQDDDAGFADWHYRRDPTHVVFYRAATFRRIAAQRGWRCETPAGDVALLQVLATGSEGA